jgi:hypothetical protein
VKKKRNTSMMKSVSSTPSATSSKSPAATVLNEFDYTIFEDIETPKRPFV